MLGEDAPDDRVWIASPAVDGAWLPAKVIARHADQTVTVRSDDGSVEVTQKAEELLLSNVLPEDGVDDMQKLNYLHEPALLHNLSHRFARDHVYTYTGKICISINPFNWDVSAPLYTQERLLSYRGREPEENPPHVYAISERAYTAILRKNRREPNGENQSILVSGESGAGKTEAVKIMMAFLASVSAPAGAAKGGANMVAERVMQSNPLLEAFGNARTLRNDNSSRFGKFIEIQFDRHSAMCGACIHVYLLEKTRVVGQQPRERNYHAFYQLLAGADAPTRARLRLEGAEGYGYTSKSGCVAIDGVDDAKDYAKVCTAMAVIGLSPAELTGSWDLVAAVLSLSNLGFEPDPAQDGAARVSEGSRGWLDAAARMVGLEAADDLSAALCTRQICARDEWYTVRLTVEQACDSRDALCKALYGRLFEWLVARVNACLAQGQPAAGGGGGGGDGGAAGGGGGGARSVSDLFVGILDIFGFECFAVNSFEQLCINYANERLQQQFNWDIFKSEQVEYESEGIEWRYIEFTDNALCLALIDKKPLGLMHVLNEESSLQAGTDQKFLDKVKAKHAGGAYFDCPKRLLDGFVVRHYAGDVEYSVHGFREKNKDSLHPDLAGLMQASESALVAQLFAPPAAPDAGASPGGARAGGGGGGKRAKGHDGQTVSTQFIAQLAALMKTINSTEVQYVRCIKPNAASKAGAFDQPRVALQLRCAGVLEAIRIARLAYPNRMAHLAFVERYALLAPALSAPLPGGGAETLLAAARRAAAAGDGAGVRGVCAQLLAAVVSGEGRFQLGSSKVFFRANLLEALEGQRGRTLGVRALVLQAAARRYLARGRFLLLRACAVRAQAGYRAHAGRARFARLRAAAVRVQAARRGAVARAAYARLRAAIALQAAVRRRLARARVGALRRQRASGRLGAYARGRAARIAFSRQRAAAVRLQARARARAQRAAYRAALVERREEALMSNRLAKLEAQLEAERKAREAASEAAEAQRRELARLADARLADAVSEAERRALAGAGGAGGAPAPAAGAPAGEAGAAAGGRPFDPNDPAILAALAAAELAAPGRFVNAAARALGGVFGGGLGGGAAAAVGEMSLEDMQAMLTQLVAERRDLRKALDGEKARRRKAEEVGRESARKLELLEHTDKVDKRRLREAHAQLTHAQEERDELRRMLSHSAHHITELEKLRETLDKKLSQYDDDFYKLEARNMRDKVKMDELAKAKAKADEERSMYKTMLQASHERGLKEKQELRREALQKIEQLSKEKGSFQDELHLAKQKLFELESALKARLRLEEEMAVYKGMLLEERMARVELEQRIEANGGVVPPPPPSSLAVDSASSAGAVAGASSRLIGGIRRLQRKDSWGRKGGSSPALPGGAVRAPSDGQPSGHKPSATAFFKGVAGGLGALANDLADAALGTDPSVAALAASGGSGRGVRGSSGNTPPSSARGSGSASGGTPAPASPLHSAPPRSPLQPSPLLPTPLQPSTAAVPPLASLPDGGSEPAPGEEGSGPQQ